MASIQQYVYFTWDLAQTPIKMLLHAEASVWDSSNGYKRASVASYIYHQLKTRKGQQVIRLLQINGTTPAGHSRGASVCIKR